MCQGVWDPKTAENTSPQCIPGFDNMGCINHCPITCADGEIMCQGRDKRGCRKSPTCNPGSRHFH